MEAHNGLKEKPVCKFLCLWTELANRQGAVEGASDLWLVILWNRRQHEIHVAGVKRFFSLSYDRSIQAVAVNDGIGRRHHCHNDFFRQARPDLSRR
jgi:hypothetical protein